MYVLYKMRRYQSSKRNTRRNSRKMKRTRRKYKGGFDIKSALNAPGNWIADNVDRAIAGGRRKKRRNKSKKNRKH
tara:strand:+ start:471 stop:695 length:225 start_codon:yes stop_codon:yes gene_type:complete